VPSDEAREELKVQYFRGRKNRREGRERVRGVPNRRSHGKSLLLHQEKMKNVRKRRKEKVVRTRTSAKEIVGSEAPGEKEKDKSLFPSRRRDLAGKLGISGKRKEGKESRMSSDILGGKKGGTQLAGDVEKRRK